MDRVEIKQQAKNALKEGKWFALLIVLFLGNIITSFTMGLLAPIVAIAVYFISIDILNGKDVDFNHFGTPFKNLNHALKVLAVIILQGLIIFAGLILLIVPGIIFALMYSQAVRILIDKPETSITGALRASKEMMNGYKGDYFAFILSFIGHFLLTIITVGIYGIYFYPLFTVADTNYYLHLKKVQSEIKIINDTEPIDPEIVE